MRSQNTVDCRMTNWLAHAKGSQLALMLNYLFKGNKIRLIFATSGCEGRLSVTNVKAFFGLFWLLRFEGMYTVRRGPFSDNHGYRKIPASRII